MSNIEHALITKVIDEKAFHVLEKAGLNESFFSIPEVIQIYQYIKQEYHNPISPGSVPSREMILYRFGAYHPFVSSDSIGTLVVQLREEKLRADIQILAQDLITKVEANPLEALAELRLKSSELSALAEIGSDLMMSNAVHMLRERYETVSQSGGVIGIPFPWQALNEESQGMQGGQFIVIYGRPKSLKTWVGIDIAVHAYITARRRVMYYTREMPPEQIAQRVAARIAKVDYKKFKNGTLQPNVRDHVFEILQDLADSEVSAAAFGYNQPMFCIVSDRNSGKGGGGVGWLQSKIRELRPELVVVDGMYLMRDDRSQTRTVDWKSITHISQDLKLTAGEFNIPLIGITQANRGAEKTKGEDLTEIAFADAIGMDTDLALRVIKKVITDEHTKQKRTELMLTAPGFREGTFDGIVINGAPATNFDYLRTIIATDELKDDLGESRAGNAGGEGRRGSYRRGGAPPDPRPPPR